MSEVNIKYIHWVSLKDKKSLLNVEFAHRPYVFSHMN